MTVFKILLYIHIIFGATSLLLGLYLMLTKKGNAIHKKIGLIYFYSMLVAAIISLALSILHPNYFLFIIGVFTSYMLLTGKRYLKKKEITDINNFDWALTLTMLVFALAFIGFGIYILFQSKSFGIVFLVFGAISLLFVWADNSNYRGKSKYKNFGLITHIQRMVGSYIATVTAFLVVNNNVLPSAIAWLLPTFIMVPLIIKWVAKYQVKAK